MLAATALALAAAVIHASWNLLAKQHADRFLALWGQFFVAAALSVVVLALTRSLPLTAWAPAVLTGLIHLPYTAALAHAYDRGDFSVAYPIARGSGAVLSTIGGIVLLDDRLNGWSAGAVALVAVGMVMLARGAHGPAVLSALVVGVAIGAYTVNDSAAMREHDWTYAFAVFVMIGVTVTMLGLATGRAGAMAATIRADGPRYLLTGTLVTASYFLVLLAVRDAPVGYVAVLRETSVVIAAFLGTRYLSEVRARQRLTAAAVVLGGLALLIASG